MRSDICSVAVFVGAMLISAGAAAAPENAPNLVPLAREMTKTVGYVRIGYTELVSIYKKAYKNAGFEFVGKTTFKDKSVELEFAFSIPEYPSKKKKGVAVISFGAELLGNRICAPCSVHRMAFGPRWDAEYTAEEAAMTRSRMEAADRNATAYIRRKLGKSLPDL